MSELVSVAVRIRDEDRGKDEKFYLTDRVVYCHIEEDSPHLKTLMDAAQAVYENQIDLLHHKGTTGYYR